MKQYIKVISVLLVLLMTVSVMVACKNDSANKDDSRDSERETETEREEETEQQLTQEDIDRLKSDMSDSILEALENAKAAETETTEAGTQVPAGTNPDYADVVEGLLGSLEGLGNGDYDYSKIISEVLDQYIGSDSTSDFITNLIMSWVQGNMGSSVPSIPMPEQTTEEVTTEQVVIPEQTTEEQTTQEQQPGNSMEALREYVAQKTAEAITDAIVERINEVANGSLRDTIYDSVYNAMSGSNGFMDGVMGESFPDLGDLWG